MSAVRYMTKWYGIHKVQESMGQLQSELARLASDPHDTRPNRNLVKRVELKLADVMAALQWFEYNNKLDVDTGREERQCENFDANHKKAAKLGAGQTHMPGVVTSTEPLSVNTNPDSEPEPETLPSPNVDTQPPSSAEVVNGCG